MTSVNTNAAAITALRTLQGTNKSLDATQNRVSTGYKIGEAKDNAAYWSISTTLKSDNKTLSTVKDALSLGSATVDVAYQGLNKAKDVLDELKKKLTAATQDGVDKGAVQDEIVELQKQLKSIATSSTFSGENWLAIDSSATGYTANKQIVSSFSRDSNNVVTLGTVEVSTATMALTNSATASEGILDGGKQGNVNKGGMADILAANSVAGTGANYTFSANPSANVTGSSGTTPNKLLIALSVNNETFTLEVTSGGNNTAFAYADFTNAIAANTALAAVMTVTGGALNTMAFTSVKKGTDTSVVINNTTFVAGASNTGGSFTFGAGAAGNGTAAKSTNLTDFTAGTNDIDLDDNDTISFSVSLDGATKKQVQITKAVVDKVLGTKDGVINTSDNYIRVLNQALSDAGLAGQVVAGKTGSKINFSGGRASIALSDTVATKGTDILKIDITNKSANEITAYLSAVSTAIDRVTSAAATLGSVASRIDMQTSFVDTLMDTIDKGVGNLIDADMSEESTKLQALQVKQQLGVQALSIANQSSQNILSLFRS